jgi:hypothetical protein
MSDMPQPSLVIRYNDDLDPLHPQNRKAAKALGWEYDPDFHAYRDAHGFVMFRGDSPQSNSVDCHR